jgi:hypothetical protein
VRGWESAATSGGDCGKPGSDAARTPWQFGQIGIAEMQEGCGPTAVGAAKAFLCGESRFAFFQGRIP